MTSDKHRKREKTALIAEKLGTLLRKPIKLNIPPNPVA